MQCKFQEVKSNAAMDALLSRHLPVITNRLNFSPKLIGPPLIITPRINFGKRLANRNVPSEESCDHTSIHNSIGGDSDMIDNSTTSIVGAATPPADVGSDSGNEDDLFLDIVETKIPKPKGQAGHPGSGGYSLDIVLRKWGVLVITDVNVSR